jgi:uncharacterized membrane protein YbhN (UPF0104 family)
MTRAARRLVWWAGALAIGLIALHVLRGFAWAETHQALLRTDLGLLAAALVVNLVSLLSKGWGWYLVLAPDTAARWWTAQEATVTGAALTSLSGSVVGEAARARLLARRNGVPWAPVIASIVYLRVVEGIGLALFLVGAPLLFDVPQPVLVAQAVAGAALIAVLVLSRVRWWSRVERRLPERLRAAGRAVRDIGSLRRLPGPLLAAVVNWGTQWATYYLTFRAAHLDVGSDAAFVALIAVNVVGLMQLPAGNLGVFQASIVVGLLPFGVAAENAVAAGIVLQALQVLPVLALAVALLGWRGFLQVRRSAPPVAAAAGRAVQDSG